MKIEFKILAYKLSYNFHLSIYGFIVKIIISLQDIQYDWANREYVELITTQIKKISDFLNSFDSR